MTGASPANRGLADAGTAAARARVAALLERLIRVELQVVVVAPPDVARLAARDRAREAAIVAGRGALLDEATAAARDLTLRAFARSGYSGTWAATDMAVSVATASDRVAAAAAFEEAATAEVVEDLVHEETLEVLRSTTSGLVGLSGVPSPGSLSALGSAGVAVSGSLPLAIVGASAIVLIVGAFAIGSASGAIIAAAGIALVAGLARRRRQSGP